MHTLKPLYDCISMHPLKVFSTHNVYLCHICAYVSFIYEMLKIDVIKMQNDIHVLFSFHGLCPYGSSFGMVCLNLSCPPGILKISSETF